MLRLSRKVTIASPIAASSILSSTLNPSIPRIAKRSVSVSLPFITERAMATPTKIKLSLSDEPVFAVKERTQESADKASELLQENHEKFHIFFNQSGFHNHIVHHLLSLYALGATPDLLQKHYDNNKSYQRPPVALEEKIVQKMHDPKDFMEFLGKEKYYHDYLVFFQEEMEQKGWEQVVKEYLCGGDVRAEALLVRMYAGFLHPIIHLGFGIEFRQPAIIAEALAQAAVHDAWNGAFLLGAEKLAHESAKTETKSTSLLSLLQQIHTNDKIRTAAHWDDANKIRDGLLVRAKQEILDLISQFRVQPTAADIQAKTAEMMNAAAYFTLLSQHPSRTKRQKIDFFHMHSLNASIFFPAFGRADFLSLEAKARLLEFKARTDLALYASRGAPKLLPEEVWTYSLPPSYTSAGRRDSATEKREIEGVNALWSDIIAQVVRVEDDGHSAKAIRALAAGERICGEERDLQPPEWWRRAALLTLDSVQNLGEEEPRWVRSAGFEEAWEKVPGRVDKGVEGMTRGMAEL